MCAPEHVFMWAHIHIRMGAIRLYVMSYSFSTLVLETGFLSESEATVAGQ